MTNTMFNNNYTLFALLFADDTTIFIEDRNKHTITSTLNNELD